MSKVFKTPQNLKELLEVIKEAQSKGQSVDFVDADTGKVATKEGGELDRLLETLKRVAEGGGSSLDVVGACAECGEVHGAEKHSGPTSEAIHALLDVVGVHERPLILKRGNFVRYRKDVQYVKRGRDLHVVLDTYYDNPRAFDMNVKDTGEPFAYRTLNVLIASYHGEIGVAKWLSDSRELELYPQAEIDKALGDKAGRN